MMYLNSNKSMKNVVSASACVVVLLLCCCCNYQKANFNVLAFTPTIAFTTGRIPTPSRINLQQLPVVRQNIQCLYMSSAPSDSASLSDDENDFSEQGYGTSSSAFDIDDESSTSGSSSTTTIPNTIDGILSKIFDVLPANSFVITNEAKDEELRAKINEMIVKLERLSASASTTTKTTTTTTTMNTKTSSPLLNGVWELRYVGGYTPTKLPFFSISPTRQLALFLYSGGYSPGVFAYTLAQQLPKTIIDTSEKCVTITISRTQPRIEASCSVKLLNGLVDGTIKVTSSLDVLSDIRFRETYESTSIVGIESPISLPKPLQYTRDLYITYLDDDILIVRDSTGVPEILLRQQKTFMKDWGFEPSMMDDMVPPGDGTDANF